MSRNGLLVLGALLAAAIALLIWLGRGADPAVAPDLVAPLLTAFAEDAPSEIALDCDGGAVTLTRDANDSWRITQPFDAEADSRRVDDLVASLRNARVKKVIGDDVADHDAFGLASTACTVRLGFGSGAPALALRLGRSSPIGSERYAATDDSRVVLTDGNLFGAVSRRAEAFREKRLFPLDPGAITRIALDRPDGPVVVSREGGAWRVETPYADAAASGACSGLAQAVAAIEVVLPDAVAAPEHALPSRRLRIELTTGGKPTRIAFVAAAGVGGRRLAWRDGARLAGLVDETAVAALTREAASFRDPRITSFSSPDVRRLTIDRGETILRIERAGEGSPWEGSAGTVAFPVDGSRVDAILDRLRGLSASAFESAAPPASLAGTLVIEGEATTLARVTWGSLARSPDADGGDVWLTTPERPGVVFRMSAASFGPIPESAAAFAPPTIPEAKAAGGS